MLELVSLLPCRPTRTSSAPHRHRRSDVWLSKIAELNIRGWTMVGKVELYASDSVCIAQRDDVRVWLVRLSCINRAVSCALVYSVCLRAGSRSRFLADMTDRPRPATFDRSLPTASERRLPIRDAATVSCLLNHPPATFCLERKVLTVRPHEAMVVVLIRVAMALAANSKANLREQCRVESAQRPCYGVALFWPSWPFAFFTPLSRIDMAVMAEAITLS